MRLLASTTANRCTGLPSDRRCLFKHLEPVIERVTVDLLGLDESGALSLHFRCVGTGEPRHKPKKALSAGIIRGVVQLHRELADRAREAVRHLLHFAHRLVLEPSCDDCSFIDARSAVLTGEQMRALFEQRHRWCLSVSWTQSR